MSQFLGVHFSLSGISYGNNSLVTLEEIGEADENSLLCVTDNLNCCARSDNTVSNVPLGEWTFPNRSLLDTNNSGDGLYRTRRTSVVRLHRRSGVTVEGGMFDCEVLNQANQMIRIYIGIYPLNESGEWRECEC